jgi:hypothetical protein
MSIIFTEVTLEDQGSISVEVLKSGELRMEVTGELCYSNGVAKMLLVQPLMPHHLNQLQDLLNKAREMLAEKGRKETL